MPLFCSVVTGASFGKTVMVARSSQDLFRRDAACLRTSITTRSTSYAVSLSSGSCQRSPLPRSRRRPAFFERAASRSASCSLAHLLRTTELSTGPPTTPLVSLAWSGRASSIHRHRWLCASRSMTSASPTQQAIGRQAASSLLSRSLDPDRCSQDRHRVSSLCAHSLRRTRHLRDVLHRDVYMQSQLD